MIPLFKPYMPKELPELNNILQSGALSYGKWGKEFEFNLRRFIGTENLLTTNAYSSAIQVALTVLDLKPGDEVITSPMSCLASNQPLITFGLKVTWADVDPLTGTLDPISVKNKITSKTKLIFHNHFCGYIGYVDEINSIGKEFGIPVIDDCIEAFGSKYKGNYAGNLGTDITIFSFQTIRLPNTIDGGAIVFKSKELYEKAFLIRDFGINRKIFRDENKEISPDCNIYMPGYGATMSEINSYIGIMQCNNLENLFYIQRNNALRWNSILKSMSSDIFNMDYREESKPNYWVYGCLVKEKTHKMLEFRANGFYSSSVHFPNSYYSIFGDVGNNLKGVAMFYSSFLALPCGWWFNL